MLSGTGIQNHDKALIIEAELIGRLMLLPNSNASVVWDGIRPTTDNTVGRTGVPMTMTPTTRKKTMETAAMLPGSRIRPPAKPVA